MDYADGRNQAVADAYKSVVRALLDNYTTGRPLVVLLPGGMGSQLDRSPAPFAGDPISFDDFGVVWIDAGILFQKDALTLEIDAGLQDKDGHIIVPDGPLRFALIPAYDGTEAFFKDQGYNYCVFGFDWRRSIPEAAVNLQGFLSDLQTAIGERFGEDPLPRTTLLCHSQGGLVAKLFLHLPETLGGSLQRIITIATPFYGTASHAQRYFQGDETLNILYGAATVAPIVGTLPGPYVLMPMDLVTWQAEGAKLGIDRYPVCDENGVNTDPYDIGNIGRYPSWVSADYVDAARLVRLTMDRPLSDEVAAKVFHLRADSTHTAALFRWGPLLSDYVAGQTASNFAVDGGAAGGGMVAGDGTVPFFSARLAQTDASRILTVPTLQTHQDLAENSRFLSAVTTVIATGAMPAPASLTAIDDKAYAAEVRPKATPGEIHSFLSDVAAGRVTNADPRMKRPDIGRGLVRELLK